MAYATSDRLKGPGDAEINSDASAFATEDVAQQAIDDIRRTLTACHDEYVAAITNLGRKSFVEGGGEAGQVEDISVTIGEAPAPPIGDSSFLLHATFHFKANGAVIDFQDDMSVFRSGRLVGTLDFDAGSGDARIRQPILALAVDRLTKADAMMSE